MRLTPEVHVLDDVEVVAEREILVDDLDPEPCCVLGAVDRDRLPVHQHLALVPTVDPGDALDQRRLAGAVVADERHHFAGTYFEVDCGERLHRAEALRQVANLEKGAAVVDVGVVGHGHPRGFGGTNRGPPAEAGDPRVDGL